MATMRRRSPTVPGIHYNVSKTWDGRRPAYYVRPVHTASGEAIARVVTVPALRRFYPEADAILSEVNWQRSVEAIRDDPDAQHATQEFQRRFADG